MWEESEKRREEQRREEKRKNQKKEMQAGAQEGRNFANQCVFQAAGAEPSGGTRDKKLHVFCGANHVSKSKCTKHTMLGALLEVEMWKKYAPLWPEARFEVESVKTCQVRHTFAS